MKNRLDINNLDDYYLYDIPLDKYNYRLDAVSFHYGKCNYGTCNYGTCNYGHYVALILINFSNNLDNDSNLNVWILIDDYSINHKKITNKEAYQLINKHGYILFYSKI